MTQQNITLPIGEHGHKISIDQAEITLLDRFGDPVNSGGWWEGDTTMPERRYEYYDNEVSYNNANDLQLAISRALEWIENAATEELRLAYKILSNEEGCS